MSSEYVMRTFLYLVRLKIFEWIKFFEDIYIIFRETELVEILQPPCMWIHRSLRMHECRDESEIYSYQQIQLSTDKFINGILWSMLDLPWL